MKNVQIPKGLFDIVPNDPKEPWKNSSLWQHVETLAREEASRGCFCEIRTPIFEKTDLFSKTSGETSDIVTKEMYEFSDKGGRSMTLRPEGTAPVMRCLIEKQLHQQSKLTKLFYLAPMFRYGRQQAGRYRQHHQFGAESIGSSSPLRDIEIIHLLYRFYQRLGLKNIKLYLNSVGDEACRLRYRQAFVHFLQPLQSQLSEYSLVRLEKNPLRILDSKEPEDREIVQKAPSILDFLSPESHQHFQTVLRGLEALNIPFEVEARLVRGLDYYTRTVFEFVAGDLGAQNTLGGGGRYNTLIASLGGPQLPAVGFGTGIERILQTLLHQNLPLPPSPRPRLVLLALGEAASELALTLLCDLRYQGISCEGIFNVSKLKTALKEVDKYAPDYRAVIGEEELKNQQLQLTCLRSKEEKTLAFSELVKMLKKQLS